MSYTSKFPDVPYSLFWKKVHNLDFSEDLLFSFEIPWNLTAKNLPHRSGISQKTFSNLWGAWDPGA